MSLGLTESELWVRAGWTMVHYLWVGTLLGLGAVACKWALESATAHARYLVALAWLAALAISPIAIAVWVGPVETAAEEQRPSDTFVLVAPDDTAAAVLRAPSVQDSQARGPGSVAATLPWGRVVAVLPWIWLFGSPVVFAWSVAGLAGAERLRRLSSPTGDPKLEEVCRRLARSLKVFREVSIRLSARIASPVLAGILRPVILLPPSLLSGLAPEQVEMLLLHELAHVRRWDNLVNFVQRTIESALFFHPVVWLVSRWVRQEREHCCDAMVLERAGDGVLYAETLLAVVQKGLLAERFKPPGIVLANSAVSPAVPGNLRSRIDRILRREDETMQVSRTLGALAPVVLVAAVVLAGSFGIPSGGAEPVQQGNVAVPSGGDEKDADTETKEAAPPEDRPVQSQPRQEAKPGTEGKVRWVNARNRVAWVNLGREKGVKKGTKFHVYGPVAKGAPLGEPKGVLVVTRILGDHLAEARIDEESPSNPISPGDRVRSPDAERETAKPGRDAIVVGVVETGDISASPGQELSAMRAELRKMHEERAVLFEKVVKLTDELHVLKSEHTKMTEELRALKSEREKMADPEAGAPSPVVGDFGVVITTPERDLVEITLGSNFGLRKGHRLDVYRPEEAGGVYVGRIEVVQTQPDRSVCRILREFLRQSVRKGDRITSLLPGRATVLLPVTLNVDEEGQTSVNGKPITLEELPELLSSEPGCPARVHLSIAAHPEVAQERIMELLTKCADARILVLSVKLYPVARDDGPPAAPAR